MATFHYLHFRTFAHETEDPEKVKAALRHAAHVEALAPQETRVEGSHKNRILFLEAEVRSAPAAKRLFQSLARDDPQGYARLRSEATQRVDENLNFYFRLDKQEAYQGRCVLVAHDDAITVRAKIRSFESKRQGAALDVSLQNLESFFQALERASGSLEQ